MTIKFSGASQTRLTIMNYRKTSIISSDGHRTGKCYSISTNAKSCILDNQMGISVTVQHGWLKLDKVTEEKDPGVWMSNRDVNRYPEIRISNFRCDIRL